MKIIHLLGGIYFSIVDDEDHEKLSSVNWGVLNGKHTKYAKFHYGPKKSRKCMLMHRLIMNAQKGLEVDHIDGNGLNNQKSNLRVSTISENRRNRVRKQLNSSSRFKGVSWSLSHKKWVSNIQVNRKKLHLGSFNDEVDAAMVYDYAAIHHFKEFASPNFKY